MSRTAFRIVLVVQCAMICVVLGSCNTVSSIADADSNKDPDVFDKVRSVDLLWGGDQQEAPKRNHAYPLSVRRDRSDSAVAG